MRTAPVLHVRAHRFTDVPQRPSPFADDRPAGADINLIVVHGISLPPGEFGGGAIERLFAGTLPESLLARLPDLRAARVSAHLLVARDGAITQFVDFDRRAWHAGTSSWRGRERCNDYSIGIEVEGTDHVAYESAQYDALAACVRALRDAYPGIAADAIVGHNDIAPGRKTDPGPAFDWQALRDALA